MTRVWIQSRRFIYYVRSKNIVFLPLPPPPFSVSLSLVVPCVSRSVARSVSRVSVCVRIGEIQLSLSSSLSLHLSPPTPYISFAKRALVRAGEVMHEEISWMIRPAIRVLGCRRRREREEEAIPAPLRTWSLADEDERPYW